MYSEHLVFHLLTWNYSIDFKIIIKVQNIIQIYFDLKLIYGKLWIHDDYDVSLHYVRWIQDFVYVLS